MLVRNNLSSEVTTNGLFGTSGSQWTNVNSKKDESSRVKAWCIAQKGTGLDSIPVKIDENISEVKAFKVFASRTAHSLSLTGRARHDRLFIGQPNEVASFSFMKIGEFQTATEANNCLLYLKTDFCNFLHSIPTLSQNTAVKNYALIPNINFSTGEILDKPGTFLDFTKPETLDDQLAAIYNLTEDERNLMTKDLKPWKDKTSVTADM
jgi:hypothetical protein